MSTSSSYPSLSSAAAAAAAASSGGESVNFILSHHLVGVYRDPARILRDASSLQSSHVGSQLHPVAEQLIQNDGQSCGLVLMLHGTLPMTYKGVTYHIPLDVYLPPQYPARPPIIYVRPVASMTIKANHKHVGPDGMVYMPYLHDWSADNCDLTELALFMSSIFGSEPPCYSAKPKQKQTSTPPRVVSINVNASPPPPQYVAAGVSSNTPSNSVPPPPPPPPPLPSHHRQQQQSTITTTGYSSILSSLTETVSSTAAAGIAKLKEEKQRRDIERQVNEANMAAAVARAAAIDEERTAAYLAAAEKDAAAEQRAMERSRQDMITVAGTKIRSAMMAIFDSTRSQLRIELQNQKQLDAGRLRIEGLTKEYAEYKTCLIDENNQLQNSIVELELWLTSVEDEIQRQQQRQIQPQKNKNNNVVDKDVTDNNKAVDLMALPADTYSAQMLALTAESVAIDDCIYFLDAALVRGRITLDVYLKEVRRLSKRQFLAKVCVCLIVKCSTYGLIVFSYLTPHTTSYIIYRNTHTNVSKAHLLKFERLHDFIS